MKARKLFLVALILVVAPLSLMAVDLAEPAPDTRGSVHSAVTHVPPQQSFIVRVSVGSMFTGEAHGHGICLDHPCVHVLTNYHVAGLIPGAKVEGIGVKRIQYATGPSDEGAVPVLVMGTVGYWNPQRDIALLTLKQPLPSNFTAARLADYAPQPGLSVMRFPATDQRSAGKLVQNGRIRYLDANKQQHEMNAMLLADFESPAGVSGGALCDAEGRVLGMTELQTGTIAIPVPTIASFLLTADPELWNQLHLQTVQPITESSATEIEASMIAEPLQLPADPETAVRSVVEQAEQMRLGMSRVVAKAEIRQSGPGVKDDPKQFEVSLYGDGIRWRSVFPNGALGQEVPDFPLPQTGVIPGADWDYLLSGLQKADVNYLGDTLYNSDIVHVFNFQNVTCPWRELRKSGEWSGNVECRGKVFSDLEYKPVFIQAEFGFEPNSIMSRVSFEITFQQFRLANGRTYALPSLVDIKAKYKRNFGTYKASAQLANYRPFGAEHVIRVD